MIPCMTAMRRVGGASKYNKFVDYANTLTSFSALPTAASTAINNDAWWKVTLGASFADSMYGSSWGGSPSFGLFTNDSVISRIAQHAFLDQIAAQENLGRMIIIGTRPYGVSATTSRDRNGYASSAWSASDADRCTGFQYFDERTQKRVHVEPYNQKSTSYDL